MGRFYLFADITHSHYTVHTHSNLIVWWKARNNSNWHKTSKITGNYIESAFCSAIYKLNDLLLFSCYPPMIKLIKNWTKKTFEHMLCNRVRKHETTKVNSAASKQKIISFIDFPHSRWYSTRYGQEAWHNGLNEW